MKKKNLIRLFCIVNIQTYFSVGYGQTNVSLLKAPLYWSPYEYCYIVSNNGMDGYIPEEEWKANIDWMNENLKLFGYNMISTDGWGDDFNFNENGYRTKYSSHWEHDYTWWSNYLQSQGMVLGVYNNPLWVNLRAVSEGKLIKGTNIPLSNIVNRDEPAKWFTWVQIEKEGAEEYVKGYIQYYADMGVKYLRVDFLSWFEDGIDRNSAFSVPYNRPKEYYQTALRWMKETCDANGITLSLVMPHLYNHAESELTYAESSLIRINDDVCDGGWYRFSDMERGNYQNIWPTYKNTFDGFIHWSDIAGFGIGKLIPDGDFTRINTFANDEERKSVISLQLIAGGPIAVADQYNSIDNHIWLYQNLELLDLNHKGFTGKPLSRDLNNYKSQIWTGQMPNGDWIVGLFNRESSEQLRYIDFQKDFGISQGYVRDLWAHNDLGLMTNIAKNIPPHGCRIYRIVPHSNQARSPIFSHQGGSYDSTINLTLTSIMDGVSIYYTTDGSDPSTASILYKKPIELTRSALIKAIAVDEKSNYSFIVGEGYNINPIRINDNMYVAGSFSNWALPQNPMHYAGYNDWKSDNIYLREGTYEFKFANSQDWTLHDWGNAIGMEGKVSITTGEAPNAVFTVSEATNYHFLFNELTLDYSIIKHENTGSGNLENTTAVKTAIKIVELGNKFFTIANAENVIVSVLSMQGYTVFSKRDINNSQIIYLDHLLPGLYIIKVEGNDEYATHKIRIK